MARYEILCLFLVVLVVVQFKESAQFKYIERDAYHAKSEYTKIACSGPIGMEREKVIEESGCGKPRDVFVHLEPKNANEEVSPGAVWLKRCVGLCEFENAGTCIQTESVLRQIPVRIYDAETSKEACATYPVEEHIKCACCSKDDSNCGNLELLRLPTEPEYKVD